MFLFVFLQVLNYSLADENLPSSVGHPISPLVDWTLTIVWNMNKLQHIPRRCWVYDMAPTMSHCFICSISKCLSVFSWEHLTPATTRFLVQNVSFRAIFRDFLGSNSWLSFVTEAGLKFSSFIMSHWGVHLSEPSHFVPFWCLPSIRPSLRIVALPSRGNTPVALNRALRFAGLVTHLSANSSSPDVSIPSHCVSLNMMSIRPSRISHFAILPFDSTLGYPGEGPQSWSCVTANIDSLATNPQCASWDDDVICIQETRVAQSNLRDTQCCIRAFDKEFFPGKLLDHTRQKNGVYRIPHGGVAILSDKSKTRTFVAKDDSTSLWNGLFASTRVTAVWHQVLPKLKVLCFTYYAKAWKQHTEDEIHSLNDDVLGKIFEVASQFGDIPILVTGDLQAEPESFSSFQTAKLNGWIDPLACFDQQGNSVRPVTYAQSSNFLNSEDHCSSIDAILLNQVAATALQNIEICHGQAKQHAPIRAVFQWPKVFLTGHVLLHPAPLVLDGIPKDTNGKCDAQLIENSARYLWNENFQHKCDIPDDETTWKNINSFGVSILLESGAKFANGQNPHHRGQPPTFVARTICPGQDLDGSAWCKRTSQLTKLHNLVSELITRLSRSCTNTADMLNQWDLQQKVQAKIGKLKAFDNWDLHDLNREVLIAIQKKLHQFIIKAKDDLKRKRINHWRNSMAKGTSSKNVSKSVYQWLRNKDLVKNPNHVADSQGNTIFQPQEAIDEINNQWDDIFAANILSEDPQTVLSKIWPLIESHRNPVDLEPIEGCHLKRQILKRKAHAAPGMDGWRTTERQNLPITFFNCVAYFFQQVENKKRSLPTILTTGKQIILDKNGSPEPLQKRLICLLPVFLLAYSGARFGQLQGWMQSTLPPNLFGAIKGRHMSSIHTSLRLQLDDAKTSGLHICGIKIDKSKCFDRIIPVTTAILFLAFGLPAELTTFLLQIYGNLKRHLSYLNWVSPVPTTSTNGVVQGCSLSLIAINLNMAVWSIMTSQIPHIVACAFIDDAYLWVRIQHAHLLSKAIETTEYWDSLCGQALNNSKCKIWGSSSKARQVVKSLFPEMLLSHIIDVLGTQIQTTETKSYGWPDCKTQKIIRDIKNIGSLPCARPIHEHIIACKVIPQLCYAPHVNQIPKTVLSRIQTKIAQTLWRNRPAWRSKSLVLGILAKPHRVDPWLSRAYNIFLDVLNFLKTTSPENRDLWIRQCNADTISPHSICASFFQACAILEISVTEGFFVSLWGSEYVSMLDFTRRDFKQVLQHACRHAAYQQACKAFRADIKQPNSVIDFGLTNSGAKAAKDTFRDSIPMTCFRESVLVGCVVTNDRASHIDVAISNMCRCCTLQKETLEHLTQCHLLPPHIVKPAFPDGCGPNFRTLGIVEASIQEVRDRMKCSSVSHISVAQWDPNATLPKKHLWTDGSCENSHLFFHTTAAFAVVDAYGHLVTSGLVKHWSLSAYAAELFAVVTAFAGAETSVAIHCDCKSVVQQVQQMIQSNCVPCVWSHLTWWHFLLHLWRIRKGICQDPLSITWIPAHNAENLPPEMISLEVAAEHNTTIWDILNNRKADHYAKSAIESNRSISRSSFDKRQKQISDWQGFLANVNAFVSETRTIPNDIDNQNDPPEPIGDNQIHRVLPHNVHGAHPIAVFQNLLPRWVWQPCLEEYTWIPSFQIGPMPNCYAKLSEKDWESASQFYKGLRWKQGECFETSFLELAAGAHHQGFTFEAGSTPAIISTLLKKFLNLATKAGFASEVHPGFCVKRCKSNGKTFPSGFIAGGYPCLHPDALKSIAIPFLRGRDHRLSQWVSFEQF